MLNSAIGNFNIIFIVILVITIAMFVGVIVVLFSPKLRGKLMGTHIRATKYMLDENKGTLTDMASSVGDIFASSTNNIINNNEDKLRNISSKIADISKDGVKTTASAIKEGFTSSINCKHCGNLIDADSMFCKHCGKER